VATIIAFNAIGLFRENLSILLGRAPNPEEVAIVERIALSVPGVLGVQGVRAEYIGPDVVHADLDILVSAQISVREADRIAEMVQQRVNEATIFDVCTVQIQAVEPGKLAGPESLEVSG